LPSTSRRFLIPDQAIARQLGVDVHTVENGFEARPGALRDPPPRQKMFRGGGGPRRIREQQAAYFLANEFLE
jgi:hypothetical protein